MIKTDCKYFKGDTPCIYHKQEAAKCPCQHYERFNKRILIIKLGAIGDVIRTTPILRKLKEIYPTSRITWVTYNPEILPSVVDAPLRLDFPTFLRLKADHFDLLLNLDKDKEACALASLINADRKKGFHLVNGRCAPIDKDAEQKWLRGLDDNLNMRNKLSYPQDIFKIAGLTYSKEKYILERSNTPPDLPRLPKPIVGLNTDCGARWRTRLWPEDRWVQLAEMLLQHNYSVLLLGGEAEHEKNLRLKEKTNAAYFGYFPIRDFIWVVDQCDLVVTQVTMTVHIAIGLGKKIALLNNIFNKNEFELYGLGKILEPPGIDCLGCYKNTCEKRCMEKIEVVKVFDTVVQFIKRQV